MKKILVIVILISNIGFAQEKSPAQIVQEQVEAYNSRDIDAFLSFYSDDVKIYTFPNKLETEGKKAMRESYASFFINAKSLNCTIKSRIIKGNFVIDEENIKYNDIEFSGVAIYEVKNNNIISVTFFE